MLGKILVILFLLNHLAVQAQEKLIGFDKDNGMTSNQITCFLVDSRGTVWFGTGSGLSIYSASKWMQIKSIDNQANGQKMEVGKVVKIFEDSKHNIWISSSANGVFLYNGQFWTNFSQEEEQGMIAVDFFEDRSGKIWVGFEQITTFKEVSNFHIIMVSGIVQMYELGEWYRYQLASGEVALKDNVPPKFFTSFLQDISGRVWIGSLEGLYCFKDGRQLELETDDLKFDKIFDVIQDMKGSVWVASETGIYCFENEKWEHFNKKNADLTGDSFSNLEIDLQNRIWAFSAVDMKFTGLNMFDGISWHPFLPESTFLKESISKLTWHESDIIAFSSGGIAEFKNEKWKLKDKKDGLDSKSYSTIYRDRKRNIFLSGNNGLYQFVDEKWENLLKRPFSSEVMQIYSDKYGNLWVVTRSSGVYKYAEENWTHFSVENEIRDLFEDKKGNIWFITNKGVLKTETSF